VGTIDQLSHGELIMLVGRQDQRLAVQDEQTTTLSRRVAKLMHANDTLTAANEELSGKLARAQHGGRYLQRNRMARLAGSGRSGVVLDTRLLGIVGVCFARSTPADLHAQS
jgi:hypothetical protein